MVAVLWLAASLCAISSVAMAQGFESPGSFGEPEPVRAYDVAPPTEAAARSYLIHDQAVKIAIVGSLSVLAVGLLLSRRFRYRKVLLLLSVGIGGFYVGGVLCPVASVQNIFLKWNTGYLVLFLIPVVLAALVGRVFCGTVCPFGAMQELLHVRRWAKTIPESGRRWLGRVKYALLLYLAVRVAVIGATACNGITPFKALFAFGGTATTIGLTVLTAGLSVVSWRPFCRFACPLGALLSFVSRFSLLRFEPTSTCTSCGVCTSRCPGGVCDRGTIRSGDCFLCGDCAVACPVAKPRFMLRRRRGASKRIDARRQPPRERSGS